MTEQAILTAAREYVAALEQLAKARCELRRGWSGVDDRVIVVNGQEKSIRVYHTEELRKARAARKRTLRALQRAVQHCRPLAGQLSFLTES